MIRSDQVRIQVTESAQCSLKLNLNHEATRDTKFHEEMYNYTFFLSGSLRILCVFFAVAFYILECVSRKDAREERKERKVFFRKERKEKGKRVSA